MMLRGTLEKYKYIGENKPKNENILIHWSVAQTGSNDEKNWARKRRLTVPLNSVRLYTKVRDSCGVCPSAALLSIYTTVYSTVCTRERKGICLACLSCWGKEDLWMLHQNIYIFFYNSNLTEALQG